MTLGEAYRLGKEQLQGMPEADRDARLLLLAAAGCTLETFLTAPEAPLGRETEATYRSYLARRVAREPVAYITGRAPFMGIELQVDRHVLIPNQDTEIVAEAALKRLHPEARILDLCTGSGCILLSLLRELPAATGVGTDLSPAALAVAKANAKALQLEARAEFAEGDLYEALKDLAPAGREFDCIVSNPPYVETAVIEGLEEEVRCYEPRLALDGGADCLALYPAILEGAKKHLAPGGFVVLEIGYDQGKAVAAMAEQAGFAAVQVLPDYGGKDRCVVAEFLPESHSAALQQTSDHSK